MDRQQVPCRVLLWQEAGHKGRDTAGRPPGWAGDVGLLSQEQREPVEED